MIFLVVSNSVICYSKSEFKTIKEFNVSYIYPLAIDDVI